MCYLSYNPAVSHIPTFRAIVDICNHDIQNEPYPFPMDPILYKVAKASNMVLDHLFRVDVVNFIAVDMPIISKLRAVAHYTRMDLLKIIRQVTNIRDFIVYTEGDFRMVSYVLIAAISYTTK